jgi:hypothetical protein
MESYNTRRAAAAKDSLHRLSVPALELCPDASFVPTDGRRFMFPCRWGQQRTSGAHRKTL